MHRAERAPSEGMKQVALRRPVSGRALSCVGALVAWFGAMPIAIAQTPARPAGHPPTLGKPGGGPIAAGAPSPKKLLDDGKRLMALHKYDDACPKIAESQKLDPKATTLFSLAQCREKAGDLAGAADSYREMAATAAAGGDTMLERLARSHVEALAAKLAKLTITLAPGADVPGLDVKLDGKSVPRASLSQPIGAAAGSHVVEATAPKKLKWSATVEVGAAGPATVTVPALADDAAAPPATPAATPRTDLGPATAASDAPVRAVGDARWTDNAGFVRPGPPPPAPQAAELPKLPPLHAQTMNRVELYLGGGRAHYAYLPSSLDPGGVTTLDGWTLRAGVGAEYRAPASLFGVFWDAGGTIRFASASSSDVVETSLFNPGLAGRVGVDFHPGRLSNVAVGAFGGYWFESYALKVSTPYARSSYSSSSSTSLKADKGPEYGVHLRLRTKESPEDVPVFQVDGSLTQKTGSAANGTYLGLRASLGGGFRVFFFVEDRIGRSGTISDSIGSMDAFAASHPLETDLGLGIGGLL